MICVICDRCGRVIRKDEKIGYISVNWRKEAGGDLMQSNPYEDCDICKDCMKEIVDVIDHMAARESVIRETPAPEDVEKVEKVLKEVAQEEPDPAEEEKEEEAEEERGDAVNLHDKEEKER